MGWGGVGLAMEASRAKGAGPGSAKVSASPALWSVPGLWDTAYGVSWLWGATLVGTFWRADPLPALPGGRMTMCCGHLHAETIGKPHKTVHRKKKGVMAVALGREFCPLSKAFGSKVTQPRSSEMMCKRKDYKKSLSLVVLQVTSSRHRSGMSEGVLSVLLVKTKTS